MVSFETDKYAILKGAVRHALRESRQQYQKSVPLFGNGAWIDEFRYCHIAPAVIEYRRDTKGIHSERLLRDAARKIYRFALDRNDDNPQEMAKLQREFFGVDYDKWQHHDALVITSWYLRRGCHASQEACVRALQSLGVHEKQAKQYSEMSKN